MDHLCDVNTLRVTKYLLTAVFLTFIAGFSKGLKQEVSSSFTKFQPSKVKNPKLKKKERLRLCEKQGHCIPKVLGMFVAIQTCLNVYAAVIKARTPWLKYVFGLLSYQRKNKEIQQHAYIKHA